MANRPYVNFAEVKQKVSIPDVLAVFGLTDRFQPKGDTKLSGCCPLPGHVHGPSPNPDQFKIDCKEGVWLWKCFGDCDRGGDVIEFVKAMKGYSDAHVRFWFHEHFAARLDTKKRSKAKPNNGGPVKKEAASDALHTVKNEGPTQAAPNAASSLSDQSPLLKPLRFFLNLDQDPNLPYFQQRGIQPATIQRFGLGLCRKGFLAGYVAIPIFGPNQPAGENPLGYLGRWPGHDEKPDRPRYKLPPDFPRNQVIFGLREALANTDGKPLIVVEGCFKVFHLYQIGFPNTIATFGAAVSEDQANLLVGTGRKIVLLLDGDPAGQAGMRTAAGKLITKTFVRVIRLEAGQEPDTIPVEQLRALLGQAK